ncbi:MAG TPA: fatty acid desaturase, partial [Vicinamibacterales bacterium]|nr:fatty acid desaturase [Vicinamibacterales bacterium]
MTAADYIRVATDDPHVARGRQLLAAHPELRDLAGPMVSSLAWILVCTSTQVAIAIALAGQPWYVWLAVAYIVGATIDHALWVLIHECAHNLILPTRLGNRLAALTANLPLVFPAAMSFCKYHLLHHRHIGELDLDADLAGPGESRAVGESRWAKAAWLAGFVVVLAAVRPPRLKTERLV